MIAVDTNILVYAHRADSKWHSSAVRVVKALAEGGSWAIPWPCVHEFLSIVTNPKIYSPPTPLEKGLDQIEAWMESPSLHLIGENSAYWTQLKDLTTSGRVIGGAVHDARIAAICQANGIRELWTADRDFGRFPILKSRNPLV